MLPLAGITVDPALQMRVEMDQGLRADYAETIRSDGWVFPPVVVYRDGKEHILSEGFHRYAAALDEGLAEIPDEVRPGTRRDALLSACGANAAHGLRLSAADKRRAVRTLLGDAEWGQASSTWIAEKCKVPVDLVSAMRTEAGPLSETDSENIDRADISLSEPDSESALLCDDETPTVEPPPQEPKDTEPEPVYRSCRDGRTMNVARIGKSRNEKASELATSAKAASQHVIMVTAALGRLRKVDGGLTDMDDTVRLCRDLGDALARYLPRLDAEARDAIVDKFREVPSA